MKVIPFNSRVRDLITGIEGFVVYRVEHMNGCLRYAVQPPIKKDGGASEVEALEGPNLIVIEPPDENLPKPVETPNAFKLGVKLRDRFSGLSGVAVLRIKYRHAGDRYGIQPPMNEKGEIPEVKPFDEEDLEQIDPPARKPKKKKEEVPSGPHDFHTALGR